MKNDSIILMKQKDYEKLSALVHHTEAAVGPLLEEELGRAEVVEDDQLPKDVVAMNSKVKFLDLEAKRHSEVTLVYPEEASLVENKISVLAPVGAALIGLRIGQSIVWPFPGGKSRTLKVLGVEPA